MSSHPSTHSMASGANGVNPQQGGWLARQEPREGLRRYVEVIRDHLRLIGACVLVALIAAGAYAKLAPKTWSAESHLLVTPISEASALVGLGLLTNSASATAAVSTASSFVTTPEVGSRVAALVGDTSSNAVLGKVSAVPVAQSNVIAITAKTSSASSARAIANAFAIETVAQQTQSLHKRLEAIIPSLRTEMAALPEAQRAGAGSVGERLSALEALRVEADPTLSVQSLASLPTGPSSPKTKLAVIAGLLVGLVIGIAIAFAQEGIDPRVRREERLREIFHLPVLARIPRERRRRSHGEPVLPMNLSPAGQESYRMLRVALGFHGGPLMTSSRSVMVTGSMPSEGKSTVALNLAVSLAQAGMHVILIEADVRRPSLASSLGIWPPVSIADVLMGDVELHEALITIDGLPDNLKLLVAGHHGQYLADGLLTATDQLIERASALAHYVVFDAPPVTQVSDVLPLSRQVDDVLVVARLGHSRSDQLVNLGEVLTREGVRPTGLVIVDDDFDQEGGYYASVETGPTKRRGLGRPRVPTRS